MAAQLLANVEHCQHSEAVRLSLTWALSAQKEPMTWAIMMNGSAIRTGACSLSSANSRGRSD